MDIDERLKNSNDNQIAAEKVLLQNANKNDISPVIKTAHRKNAVHYAHIECIPNFDNSILNLQTWSGILSTFVKEMDTAKSEYVSDDEGEEERQNVGVTTFVETTERALQRKKRKKI